LFLQENSTRFQYLFYYVYMSYTIRRHCLLSA